MVVLVVVLVVVLEAVVKEVVVVVVVGSHPAAAFSVTKVAEATLRHGELLQGPGERREGPEAFGPQSHALQPEPPQIRRLARNGR